MWSEINATLLPEGSTAELSFIFKKVENLRTLHPGMDFPGMGLTPRQSLHPPAHEIQTQIHFLESVTETVYFSDCKR